MTTETTTETTKTITTETPAAGETPAVTETTIKTTKSSAPAVIAAVTTATPPVKKEKPKKVKKEKQPWALKTTAELKPWQMKLIHDIIDFASPKDSNGKVTEPRLVYSRKELRVINGELRGKMASPPFIRMCALARMTPGPGVPYGSYTLQPFLDWEAKQRAEASGTMYDPAFVEAMRHMAAEAVVASVAAAEVPVIEAPAAEPPIKKEAKGKKKGRKKTETVAEPVTA